VGESPTIPREKQGFSRKIVLKMDRAAAEKKSVSKKETRHPKDNQETGQGQPQKEKTRRIPAKNLRPWG